MRGEIDFLQALEMRLALLEGLPESVFDEVLSQISFSDGFGELFEYLRRNHFLIGAVSGGFHNVLDKLFADLNLDFLRANTLEVKDSKISGKLLSQPIDRAAKGQALKEFAASYKIKLEQTVAVGDGANDLEMIELAGLGVSYMGKEILKNRADLHLDRPGLDALIQYLK
jgi:phosphoserine phosphatase